MYQLVEAKDKVKDKQFIQTEDRCSRCGSDKHYNLDCIYSK